MQNLAYIYCSYNRRTDINKDQLSCFRSKSAVLVYSGRIQHIRCVPALHMSLKMQKIITITTRHLRLPVCCAQRKALTRDRTKAPAYIFGYFFLPLAGSFFDVDRCFALVSAWQDSLFPHHIIGASCDHLLRTSPHFLQALPRQRKKKSSSDPPTFAAFLLQM